MRSRIVVRVGPRWRAQRRRAQNRAHGTGPTPTAASIAAPRSPPCTRGRRLGENTSPSPSSRYPRARGADLTMMWMWSPPFPLPPRTRGRLPSAPGGHGGAPSTPAHAGPTAASTGYRRGRRPYPRARGADSRTSASVSSLAPLPPRTRGRRRRREDVEGIPAPTPAHAGPTRGSRLSMFGMDPYPRARGADAGADLVAVVDGPLPPRTRGRRRDRRSSGGRLAPTPAHAGPTLEYR